MSKPRLNLDIFSKEESAGEEKKEPISSVAANVSKTKESSAQAAAPSPKFVPVGFYPEHLRLLDDAVLALRRTGRWKASKSAIIRRLIELHSGELDRVYLEEK